MFGCRVGCLAWKQNGLILTTPGPGPAWGNAKSKPQLITDNNQTLQSPVHASIWRTSRDCKTTNDNGRSSVNWSRDTDTCISSFSRHDQLGSATTSTTHSTPPPLYLHAFHASSSTSMHFTPPAPGDYRFFFAELCTKTPSLTAQTSSTDTFIAPPSTAVKLMR